MPFAFTSFIFVFSTNWVYLEGFFLNIYKTRQINNATQDTPAAASGSPTLWCQAPQAKDPRRKIQNEISKAKDPKRKTPSARS